MIIRNDRKLFQPGNNTREFSETVHQWLAQYDEEDDFLCDKALNSLPDITEEK